MVTQLGFLTEENLLPLVCQLGLGEAARVHPQELQGPQQLNYWVSALGPMGAALGLLRTALGSTGTAAMV